MVKAKNKGKASGIKLGNKHTSKLAKRGHLPHQKKKKNEKEKLRIRAQLAEASNPMNTVKHVQEEIVEDEEYFDEVDVSFARSINKDANKGKRKNYSSVEKLFENSKRANKWIDQDDSAPLLPIKHKNKLIQRALVTEKPEVEEPVDDMEVDEVNSELPNLDSELSVVELMAQREKALSERKQSIASLSCAIVENPHEYIRKLKTLRELWDDDDVSIQTASRKLLLISLTEIFKDIIPDYRIRIATQSEKQQVAKAETKQLRNFEENLLHNYKMYLQLLEECIGKSTGRVTGAAGALAKMLRRLACKCMCDVFTAHPTFNFSKNIIAVLTPLLTTYDSQILDTVCETYKTVFKEDKGFETSLEIVRSVCKIVKSKNFMVDPRIMDIFMSLRIKEIRNEDDTKKKRKMTHKEKMKLLSRNERKRDKKRAVLDKQLEEAAVQVDTDKLLQTKTDIISAIFTLYFIILKKDEQSNLLSAVLAGLAKFAHLINVDFFDDLFRVFNQLISSDVLTIEDIMNIVQTSFTILSGQGEALNIDPQHFYSHLYKILPQLSSKDDKNSALIKKLPGLIKLLFLDRKRKVTNTRIQAYTKRLTSLAVKLYGEDCICVLEIVKTMCSIFRCTEILLDNECIGNGIYRADLDEPEYCNAQNSTILHELHLLAKHHPLPAIQQTAKFILKKSPEHSTNEKRCQLCTSSVDQILEKIQSEYITSDVSNKNKKKSNKGSTIEELRSIYC